jgi:Ulp1 family protease
MINVKRQITRDEREKLDQEEKTLRGISENMKNIDISNPENKNETNVTQASVSLEKKLKLLQTRTPKRDRLQWRVTKSDVNLVVQQSKHGSLLSAVYRAFYATRRSKHGPDAELYAQKKRPLKFEDDAKVTEVLARKDDTVFITPGTGVDLTYKITSCINTRRWLNDGVINFYFQLLKERNDRANNGGEGLGPQPPLKAHFFNSFFIARFEEGYSYKKVQHTRAHANAPQHSYTLTSFIGATLVRESQSKGPGPAQGLHPGACNRQPLVSGHHQL